MGNSILMVGNVDLFDNKNNLILSARTLTDSGLNMGINVEEVRGGLANALLGRYFHDSSFSLTLTDPIWDLNYLALSCGGSIVAGGDVLVVEQFTVKQANTLEVKETPKSFTATSGIIGWYKLSTEDDKKYRKFDFTTNEKKATVEGLTVGTTICIKYVITDDTARKFVVNADYIPDICHAVVTYPLFKASGTASLKDLGNSARIGELIVDIPYYQLDGTQDLAVTSTGSASVSLSGSAIAGLTGDVGCSDHGAYATITERIYGQDELANVSALVVAGGNIELSHNETQTIKVYKMYSDGTQPSLIDNTKLTFTASGTSATVNDNGVVTAKTTDGVTTIEIVAKGKTTLTTACVVNVSA